MTIFKYNNLLKSSVNASNAPDFKFLQTKWASKVSKITIKNWYR